MRFPVDLYESNEALGTMHQRTSTHPKSQEELDAYVAEWVATKAPRLRKFVALVVLDNKGVRSEAARGLA